MDNDIKMVEEAILLGKVMSFIREEHLDNFDKEMHERFLKKWKNSDDENYVDFFDGEDHSILGLKIMFGDVMIGLCVLEGRVIKINSIDKDGNNQCIFVLDPEIIKKHIGGDLE